MNAQTVKNIPMEMLTSWPLALGRLPIMTLRFAPDTIWREPFNQNPVLLIPGLGAPPITMAVLDVGLRYSGFWVYNAPISRNLGSFEVQGPALLEKIEEISNKHNRPVDIVGWSMGGRYALRLAEVVPGKIGKIVTLGSPIQNVAISPFFEELWRTALTVMDIPPERVQEEMETPISLPDRKHPLSSIVGNFDAVVADESSLIPASMLKKGSRRENIRVPKGHIGMGMSLDVFDIAADRLAQRRVSWQPYQPALH